MIATNDDKEVTLTRNEQRVYLEILRNKIATMKEITEVTGNYKTSRSTISRLVSKGYTIRAHRGFYAAVPPEFIGSNYEVDRYILAYKVGREHGILAFHTALELHGVAQSYYNTVYSLRANPLRNFEFQGIEYRFVRSNAKFGTTVIKRDGIQIEVTDRERTIIDCIRKLDYSGGLEELIKSLGTFHKIDIFTLETYLKRYGERSLILRTGYILSLIQNELRIPEDFLYRMKRKAKERVYYLIPDAKNGSGKYIKEWNMIVPKNLDEVVRFA